MKKILVTGANGQLGKEFRELAVNDTNNEFLFLTREDLPIHHFDLVRNVFDSFKPDYCINCAAYTAVDKAEQEKELALLVNAESVGVLAAVCRQRKTKFFHISTDYVFDGEGTKPYKEEDPTSPQSVYGLSKKMGEDEAFKNNADSIIIRTSWVYSKHGNNFVKTMMRLMNEKDSISVVSDQHGTPTWAADIAQVIMHIIKSNQWSPGIYHFSNAGTTTWYDFAQCIKKMINSNCIINPIPTSSYPTPAKRPKYSVLDKQKIINTFNVKLIDWQESLGSCIEAIKKN
jgi:dTDP-4-dehydrorhamnose reductase